MGEKSTSRMMGISSLLLLTLIWGTTFPEIKIVVTSIGYSYYVALRFGIATLLLSPWAFLRRSNLASTLRPGALLGLLFFGGITLQGLGMEYTSSSNAAFITGLSVVIIYVVEVVSGREKPSRRLATAVVLSIAGLYLISFTERFEPRIGDLIVLAGAFFWAFQIISAGIYSKLYALDCLLYLQNAFTAAGGLVLISFSQPPTTLGLNDILLHLLYLSTGCTILANFLQLYGQRRVRNVEAAIIYLMEPVFAAFFSYIIMGEVLTFRQYIGAALILMAMIISSLPDRRE